MRIIVLGDTHIPKRAKHIPSIVKDECQNSDLIIHVGDWQTMCVYQDFIKYGMVEGVHGNIDSKELMEFLPKKKVININGVKIGITHGHGTSQTTEKRVLAAFGNEDLDCILFGHSHIPLHKKVGNVILFNPGSATDKRRQQYYSYGLLKITDHVSAEHVYFSDRS